MTRYFEYLRPESAEEAVKMKATHGVRAKFWAGGTDMMLQWKADAVELDYCIDLSHVSDLRYVKVEDGALRIGSLATLEDIDRSSGLNNLTEALGETVRLMCTKQTRSIATVGGNMCNASPSADLAPPLVAMGAVAKILGPEGEREVLMENFQTGVKRNCLAESELLVEIVVPDVNANVAAHYNRVARTVVDIALVSAAAFIKLGDDGVIEKAAVTLGAVAPSVLKVVKAEELLVGSTLAQAADALAEQAGEESSKAATAITDIRASKEYRTDMTAVLTRRAIRRCVEVLGGAK